MEDDSDIIKNTKAKADVWLHFGLKKRKSDATIVDSVVVCFICKMQSKTGGGGRQGRTRNLVTHIHRHHQ